MRFHAFTQWVDVDHHSLLVGLMRYENSVTLYLLLFGISVSW